MHRVPPFSGWAVQDGVKAGLPSTHSAFAEAGAPIVHSEGPGGSRVQGCSAEPQPTCPRGGAGAHTYRPADAGGGVRVHCLTHHPRQPAQTGAHFTERSMRSRGEVGARRAAQPGSWSPWVFPHLLSLSHPGPRAGQSPLMSTQLVWGGETILKPPCKVVQFLYMRNSFPLIRSNLLTSRTA